MAKVLYLSGWFMLGCSASSLVSWFGSLHPGAFKIAIAFYSLVGVAWILCWLGDDAISSWLKVPHLNWRYCNLVNQLIKLILQILPSEIVSIINEKSLEELDKRGWIIWDKSHGKSNR